MFRTATNNYFCSDDHFLDYSFGRWSENSETCPLQLPSAHFDKFDFFFLHPTNSPKNFNQCMTTANSSIREAGRSKLCSYSILSNPFYLMTHHWHRQRCYVTQVMFLYIYTLYFLLFYSSSNTFLSSSFRKNKSSMKMKWSKLRCDLPHIHH